MQFSKFNNFLWVCWFLGKNLSNFVSLVWKSNNPYYHQAVLFGHVDTVKWIYDHYPESITQVNCNGKTPVDIAKENPYGNPTGKRIIEILTEYPFRFTTLETIMKGVDLNAIVPWFLSVWNRSEINFYE